jgi:hypothetical protein
MFCKLSVPAAEELKKPTPFQKRRRTKSVCIQLAYFSAAGDEELMIGFI